MNLNLGLTRELIAACGGAGLSTAQTAYVLATNNWESNGTMRPVEEGYYLGGERARRFQRSTRYYPYYGRGFPQITWEENYLKLGKRLGLGTALVDKPDLALDPVLAVKIAVIGMTEGLFTGRKLSDYINSTKTDFIGARRIVNGTDKAKQIADLADQYLDALAPVPDYPFIRRGSRGEAVAVAQAALNKALGLRLKVDGIFGSATDEATRTLQSRRGLTDDGIIGPKTWDQLEDFL